MEETSNSPAPAPSASPGSDFTLEEIKQILAYIRKLGKNPGKKANSADTAARKRAMKLRERLYVGPPVNFGPRGGGSTSASKKSESENRNRPCTPSRFSEAVPAQAQGSSSQPAKPANDFEALLGVVRRRYFGGETPASSSSVRSATSAAPFLTTGFRGLQGPIRHASLGILLLPTQRPSVIERWTLHDIAVFEAAMCIYGKQFHKVSRALGDAKTTKEVVEFYYAWKKTSHYTSWKKMHAKAGGPQL